MKWPVVTPAQRSLLFPSNSLTVPNRGCLAQKNWFGDLTNRVEFQFVSNSVERGRDVLEVVASNRTRFKRVKRDGMGCQDVGPNRTRQYEPLRYVVARLGF